jgi:hypothetical protein
MSLLDGPEVNVRGMLRPEMKVVGVFPPIPTRAFDWCAYRDGEEENGRYGWGETATAAVADLLEREIEDGL